MFIAQWHTVWVFLIMPLSVNLICGHLANVVPSTSAWGTFLDFNDMPRTCILIDPFRIGVVRD